MLIPAASGLTCSRTVSATRAHTALLAIILVVAAAVRVWSLQAGVPFALGVDEPAVVDRALRILQTGDWNPHVFDYPTLVIYFHAVVAGVTSIAGAAIGRWSTPADMDIVSVYTACRLAAALLGVGTAWLTYGLARELGGGAAGLAAAALLAVIPMHVRESHYVLTDVPAAALVVGALWAAVRAGDRSSMPLWVAAGALAGLAAGAKYNGGVVLGAVTLAPAVSERGWNRRALAIVSAIAAAILAYFVVAPFTVLDFPHFAEGFSAQMSRFTGSRPLDADPVWLVYLKHLALNGTAWLWTAAAGLAIVAARPERLRAVAPVTFLALYGYVLATHSLVFGRYALPLVPVLCVFTAIGVVGVITLAVDRAGGAPWTRGAAIGLVVLLVASGFATRTIAWLRDFDGPDTRRSAADWMSAALPPGSRVAVDVSGPTNLAHAGFRVTFVPRLPADDEWYERRRIDYAVFAWRGRMPATPPGAGLFEILPAPRRWGPAIRVIQVNGRVPGPQ